MIETGLTSRPPPPAPRPLLLALSSAVLLVASFPNVNQPWCAWVALVPWLLLLRRVRGRAAFWWSWLIGLLFFLGSIWWMAHLTAFGGPLAIVGWLALSAYLALYFGLFGWLAAISQSWDMRHETRDMSPVSRLLSQTILLVPALWVSLEFARSHLLSGFGWNLLAYSQTPWQEVIQLAAVTGAWGVSFVIVLVNALLASACAQGEHPTKRAIMGAAALLTFAGMWLSGLQAPPAAAPAALVAVVQGNIPQEEKWDDTRREHILSRYEALTKEAAETQPDLIVWPETSVPGFFNVDEELTQRVMTLAAAVDRPLLLGSPAPHLTPEGLSVTNRATLLGASGGVAASYDKLHLVPFGEFVPGDRVFPWLRNLLPPIGDFVPGTDYTVFTVAGSRLEALGSRQQPHSLQPTAYSHKLRFSALICFEDIFPGLARQFVRRGAQMLVVITNDAWFGPTAAAYQHAQASALRAVELGVPVIRAANTGWSGCIDQRGRWHDAVRDSSGRELFVAGTSTCGVTLSPSTTLYLRWGDWFAWLCVLWAGFWVAMRRLNLFLIKRLR